MQHSCMGIGWNSNRPYYHYAVCYQHVVTPFTVSWNHQFVNTTVKWRGKSYPPLFLLLYLRLFLQKAVSQQIDALNTRQTPALLIPCNNGESNKQHVCETLRKLLKTCMHVYYGSYMCTRGWTVYLPGRGMMQYSLTLSFPQPPARREVMGVGREREEGEGGGKTLTRCS